MVMKVPFPAQDGDTLVASGGIFVPSSELPVTGAIPANRIASGLGVGRAVKASQIADAVLGGVLTLTAALSAARAVTFPDSSLTVAGIDIAQTFTAAQTIHAASGLLVRQAATQDGVALLGRAGGASSRQVQITVPALTATRTFTLLDADVIAAGSAAALTSTRIPVVAGGGLLNDFSSLTYSNGLPTLTIGAGAGYAGLYLNGAAAQSRQFVAVTAGVNRWALTLANSTAESGSDAGSNFQLVAYTDAGAGIDTPLSINRVAGGAIALARVTQITGVAPSTYTAARTDIGGGRIHTAEMGLGILVSAGAGLLQFSAGTTIANGIAMNSCGIFANAAGALTLSAANGVSLTNALRVGTSTALSLEIARFVGGTIPTGVISTSDVLIGGGTIKAGFAVSVTGAAATSRDILLQTASVNRWAIRADSSAEAGANAGSAFSINARDDAGAGIDAPLTIVRAAGGAMTIVRPITATSTLAVTGLITTGSAVLMASSVALTNGAAAAAGTLLNAPAAGNPTKWIPINDNGTTRYIPSW